jgi:hypothetical protein
MDYLEQVLVREGSELSHKIGELVQYLITPIKGIETPAAGSVVGDAGEELNLDPAVQGEAQNEVRLV